LDHGAGAACFSGGKGNAVLLDCGDHYNFKRQVAPSLRRLGVSPDSVILSHPDGGHLGGGAAVWTTFPIRQVLLPVSRSRSPGFQSWAEAAPAAGIQTLQASEISELPMPDEARLEILHVPDALSKNAVADERAAIYRLHWRGWKLLFTSDAGMNTETAMLDAKKDLSADVIIAGHHRSDTSLSDPFLDAVNPQIIVASHSALPATERLNPATVSYWRSRGIQVIHQGESGGVTIKVNQVGDLMLEGFADQSVIQLMKKH
jgi:competence protein ComEC